MNRLIDRATLIVGFELRRRCCSGSVRRVERDRDVDSWPKAGLVSFAKLNEETKAGRRNWPGDELIEGVSDPRDDTYEGSPLVAIRPELKIAKSQIAIVAIYVTISVIFLDKKNLQISSFPMIYKTLVSLSL